MSNQEHLSAPKRPSGRRAGDSGTRQAILESAQQLFAQMGYEAASIRTIATSAGVDPALIRHFFGDKATLFAATVAEHKVIPERLQSAFEGDPQHLGFRVVDVYLRLWEEEETRNMMMALVRSAATSEKAADMLKTVLGSRMRGVPQVHDGDSDQSQRIVLAASHMLGIGFTRYILKLPEVSTRTHEEIVSEVGPAIQRYLTGTHR